MTDSRRHRTQALLFHNRRNGGRRSTGATAAGLVFVAVLVVALPLYLVRGNNQWFFLDDWDFLAARKLTSVHDLLRPHNEHWTTLPIIVYRVLWRFVGLRSYAPYQAVLVALHLTAAVLLRRIMRRAGVGAWVATAAATLFVFLGSGRQNIVWAFQITFVGALVCGLAHLILADHDGPPNRRDAVGLAFGALGLMCSGVAVSMTIIVGLAVFIRRGWRAAALNTVPLGVIFGVWFVGFGRSAYRHRRHGSLAEVRRFVTTGLRNAFAEMGQVRGIGVVLALVLVVGLVLAWARLPLPQLRRRAAAPAALLIGSVIYFAISGYGRGFRSSGQASRYVHLAAAMTLPAIAVAADALARRWRLLTPAVVVLLVLGVPGNIDAINPKGRERITLGYPPFMLELPRSPFATRVPRSVRPNPSGAHEVTIGWLLDGVRSGRIPSPPVVTPDLEAVATLALVLAPTTDLVPARDCVAVVRPLTVRVRRGDVLVFRGGRLAAQLILANGRRSVPLVFQPLRGSTLHVEGGPVTVVFTRARRADGVVLCRGA